MIDWIHTVARCADDPPRLRGKGKRAGVASPVHNEAHAVPDAYRRGGSGDGWTETQLGRLRPEIDVVPAGRSAHARAVPVAVCSTWDGAGIPSPQSLDVANVLEREVIDRHKEAIGQWRTWVRRHEA